MAYLDNILSALIQKELIVSIKGNGSGYKLNRTSEEITMHDIYTTFEPIVIVGCINNNLFCKMFCDCVAKDYWPEFKAEFEEILNELPRSRADEVSIQWNFYFFAASFGEYQPTLWD